MHLLIVEPTAGLVDCEKLSNNMQLFPVRTWFTRQYRFVQGEIVLQLNDADGLFGFPMRGENALSTESVNKVLNSRQSIRFIVSRTFRSTIGRMLSVVLLFSFCLVCAALIRRLFPAVRRSEHVFCATHFFATRISVAPVIALTLTLDHLHVLPLFNAFFSHSESVWGQWCNSYLFGEMWSWFTETCFCCWNCFGILFFFFRSELTMTRLRLAFGGFHQENLQMALYRSNGITSRNCLIACIHL